ncbi:MAG: HPr kinase/phosphorylase, partial [Xanthomonadales bacterium]|nr:HPr kinase/phosphorylase [Xanthomonadales bacterium]
MNQSISAAELFRSLKDRLQLSRAAGPEGENRAVAATDSPELRPSLCGFLNLVHPNDIQVLGLEELRYLDSLDSRKRWETIAAIIADKPVALIVSDDLMVPDDLAEGAEESRMPLWRSP